jgi:hypothetical protein
MKHLDLVIINGTPGIGCPFDEHVTRSLVQGIPLTESVENSVSKEIKKIWQRILSLFSSDDSLIEGKQTGGSLLSEYPSRNTNIV